MFDEITGQDEYAHEFKEIKQSYAAYANFVKTEALNIIDYLNQQAQAVKEVKDVTNNHQKPVLSDDNSDLDTKIVKIEQLNNAVKELIANAGDYKAGEIVGWEDGEKLLAIVKELDNYNVLKSLGLSEGGIEDEVGRLTQIIDTIKYQYGEFVNAWNNQNDDDILAWNDVLGSNLIKLTDYIDNLMLSYKNLNNVMSQSSHQNPVLSDGEDVEKTKLQLEGVVELVKEYRSLLSKKNPADSELLRMKEILDILDNGKMMTGIADIIRLPNTDDAISELEHIEKISERIHKIYSSVGRDIPGTKSRDQSGVLSGTDTTVPLQDVVEALEFIETEEEEVINKTKEMYRAFNSGHGIEGKDGISWFGDDIADINTYLDNIRTSKDSVAKLVTDTSKFLQVDAKGSSWDEILFNGGLHTTEEIAEMAKQMGYLGVEFKNIQDNYNGLGTGNIFAIFDSNIIKEAVEYTDEFKLKAESIEKVFDYGTEALYKFSGQSKQIYDEASSSFDEVVENYKKGLLTIEEAYAKIDSITSNLLPSSSSDQTEVLSGTTPASTVTRDIIEEQKALGELELAFRGVEGSVQGFMSTSGRLATFFTNSPYLARQYADSLGGVYQAQVALGNSLEIQGKGRDWNAIEYLGDGSDEASEKIIKLRQDIDLLCDQLTGLNVSGTGLEGAVEYSRGDYSYLVRCFGDMGTEYDSYIDAVEKGNIIKL